MKKLIYFNVLFLVAVLSASGQVKVDSLLAHYPFDSNTLDNSGNNANATGFNLIDTTNRFNDADKAYAFNGTNGYVLLPNDSALKPSFPFSISFWLYIDSFPTLHQTVYKSDDINNNYAGFWITLNPQGEITAAYGNGNGVSIYNRRTKHSNGPISKDKWLHIAVSFNGLNSTELYVDGVNQTGYYSGFASSLGYSSATGVIGRYITNSQGTRFINALIDDVRIYNDTLDQLDVNYLNFELPCTKTYFDSLTIVDTVLHTANVFDTVQVFDSITVIKNLVKYDTIAIANTLLINSSLSIAEDLNTLFNVYPNPSNSFFFVDLSFDGPSLEGKRIVITNSQGQVINKTNIQSQKTKFFSHKLGSSGVYFIELRDELDRILIIRKIILN